MKTPQLEHWTGDWGRKYVEDNSLDPQTFVPYWEQVLNHIQPKSILEVGCNIGLNLSAIHSIRKDINLTGIEPYIGAVEKARQAITTAKIVEGDGFDLPFKDGEFDLTCSLGVMIHIATKDLKRFIEELYRVSSKYILISEYQIEGNKEVLYPKPDFFEYVWSRNYKQILEDTIKANLIAHGQWWEDKSKWFLYAK